MIEFIVLIVQKIAPLVIDSPTIKTGCNKRNRRQTNLIHRFNLLVSSPAQA